MLIKKLKPEPPKLEVAGHLIEVNADSVAFERGPLHSIQKIESNENEKTPEGDASLILRELMRLGADQRNIVEFEHPLIDHLHKVRALLKPPTLTRAEWKRVKFIWIDLKSGKEYWLKDTTMTLWGLFSNVPDENT